MDRRGLRNVFPGQLSISHRRRRYISRDATATYSWGDCQFPPAGGGIYPGMSPRTYHGDKTMARINNSSRFIDCHSVHERRPAHSGHDIDVFSRRRWISGVYVPYSLGDFLFATAPDGIFPEMPPRKHHSDVSKYLSSIYIRYFLHGVWDSRSFYYCLVWVLFCTSFVPKTLVSLYSIIVLRQHPTYVFRVIHTPFIDHNLEETELCCSLMK